MNDKYLNKKNWSNQMMERFCARQDFGHGALQKQHLSLSLSLSCEEQICVV